MSLPLNGMVQPNQEALVQVTPRFPGIVREVRKRIGDRVEKGDVLAVVESNQSLTSYDLKAAIAGTVIDRQTTLGEYVSEQKPAFVIADLSTVWVDFSVYRRDLGRVDVGDQVLIDPADGGRRSRHNFLSVAGRQQRNPERVARAVVPNSEQRLRPGLFITGRLTLSAKQVAGRREILGAADHRKPHRRVRPQRREVRSPRRRDRRADSELVEITFGVLEGDVYAAKNSFIVKAELAKGGADNDLTRIPIRFVLSRPALAGDDRRPRHGGLSAHGISRACRSTPFPTSRTSRSRSTAALPAIRRWKSSSALPFRSRPPWADFRPRKHAVAFPIRPEPGHGDFQGRHRHLFRPSAGQRADSAGRDQLPTGIETAIGPVSTGLGEIYMFTVEAKPDAASTERRALTPRATCARSRTGSSGRSCELFPGVNEVNTVGGFEKQFHVLPDPAQLMAYKLSFRDVMAALAANNANVGAGYIEHNGEQYLVRTPGQVAQHRRNQGNRDRIARRRAGAGIRRRRRQGRHRPAHRRGNAERQGSRARHRHAADRREQPHRRAACRRQTEGDRAFAAGRRGRTTVYDRTRLVEATIATVEKNLFEGALLVVVVCS